MLTAEREPTENMTISLTNPDPFLTISLTVSEEMAKGGVCGGVEPGRRQRRKRGEIEAPL